MAALLTRLQLWNHALDLLREQPIADVNDQTAAADWLRRNYEQQRDYLLTRYLWKFALRRQLLASDPVAPDWGWAARYRLPADCLRFLPPTVDGAMNGTPILYEHEGDFILCNENNGLRLRYIGRVGIDGNFSTGFAECLALRLAGRMAHWLTGKQSMAAELQQAYRETLADTVAVEALQAPVEAIYDEQPLGVRYGDW